MHHAGPTMQQQNDISMRFFLAEDIHQLFTIYPHALMVAGISLDVRIDV
jgi:hypothetical protein